MAYFDESFDNTFPFFEQSDEERLREILYR